MGYFCSQCGYSTPSWLGRCPQCGEWNTFLRKEQEIKPQTHSKGKIHNHVQAVSLSELSHKATEMASRFKTGLSEVDRVLGGGIVEGSLVLLSGDPGIGKSTLLLKISHSVASCGKKVLYVSSEESVAQLFLRINRLKIDSYCNLFLLSANFAEDIFSEIERIGPDLVIIDSVQNLGFADQQSSAGSASVVRELSSIFMNIAKREKRAFFVVGHVTKEGVVAGPKTLEHLVDVVLYLEGDPHLAIRLLRSIKNRFGPTWEVGILEMKENGLTDVEDPSHLFLAPSDLSGVGGARTVLVEGKRPLMVEIQSLVNNSYLDYPRRVALGIESGRLFLIVAILEKMVRIRFGKCDVYVSVVGGIRTYETSTDLALCFSLVSSKLEKPISRETVFIGEVGLSGEIRPTPLLEYRLREAARRGIKRAIISHYAIAGEWTLYNKFKGSLELSGYKNIHEALKLEGLL